MPWQDSESTSVLPAQDAPGLSDPPGITRYPGSRLMGIYDNLTYDDEQTPVSMAEYLALASSSDVRSFYLDRYSRGWEQYVDHMEPDGSTWWAGFAAADGEDTVSVLSLDVSPSLPEGPAETVSVIMFFVPASDKGTAP
jgi:hypothetical protein